MNLLFAKKYDNNTVLKIYRIVTKEQAASFETNLLINSVLITLNDFFQSFPTDYFITGPYPDKGWKTKDGFLKAVEKKQYRNICHLILSTENYYFSFENWLLNDKEPKEIGYQSIEFSISENYCDFLKMETFYKKIVTFFPPDYGYIFKLPTNYLPTSESKIKKGFLGTSVSINSSAIKWSENIIRVNKAFLKDIYPINFLNDSVINSHDFFKGNCRFKYWLNY